MNKIKEMIKIIEEDCKKTDCKGLSDCVSCNCEALINAGYRKESEVAKEIFEKLYYLSHDVRDIKGLWTDEVFLEEITKLAKEYGVEL